MDNNSYDEDEEKANMWKEYQQNDLKQLNELCDDQNEEIYDLWRESAQAHNDNSIPKHFWVKVMNIACYLQNKIYIRLPMNCGRDKNPTYHTFIPLDVNVSFLTLKITWKILIQKVIMEHFLNTLKHLRHTEFTALEPWKLRKLFM